MLTKEMRRYENDVYHSNLCSRNPARFCMIDYKMKYLLFNVLFLFSHVRSSSHTLRYSKSRPKDESLNTGAFKRPPDEIRERHI